MDGLNIRRARTRDLDAMTRIYNHYVANTPVTFDIGVYALDARRSWLEGFDVVGRHQLFVADKAGVVLGYAGSMRYGAKAAYETTVETTVYVEPTQTGQGLGSRLYAALFEALSSADVHRALAGITLPNEASQALHRRFGFHSCGVLHEVGLKLDRYWDVEWLEKAL